MYYDINLVYKKYSKKWQQKFEDTKGLIRSRKSKDGQYNEKKEFVYIDDMLSLSQSWMLILTTSEYHVN